MLKKATREFDFLDQYELDVHAVHPRTSRPEDDSPQHRLFDLEIRLASTDGSLVKEFDVEEVPSPTPSQSKLDPLLCTSLDDIPGPLALQSIDIKRANLQRNKKKPRIGHLTIFQLKEDAGEEKDSSIRIYNLRSAKKVTFKLSDRRLDQLDWTCMRKVSEETADSHNF